MIPYQCQNCDEIKELTTNQSNRAVRLKHPCHACDTFATHEKLMEGGDDDLSIVEREYLRQVNPEVWVTRRSTSTKILHMDAGDGKLCNNKTDVRRVSVKTFPIGQKDWCQHCIERFREDRNMGRKELRSEIIKAIQKANQRSEYEISVSEYRDKDIEPTVYYIKKEFGSWGTAKEVALRD